MVEKWRKFQFQFQSFYVIKHKETGKYLRNGSMRICDIDNRQLTNFVDEAVQYTEEELRERAMWPRDIREDYVIQCIVVNPKEFDDGIDPRHFQSDAWKEKYPPES